MEEPFSSDSEQQHIASECNNAYEQLRAGFAAGELTTSDVRKQDDELCDKTRNLSTAEQLQIAKPRTATIRDVSETVNKSTTQRTQNIHQSNVRSLINRAVPTPDGQPLVLEPETTADWLTRVCQEFETNIPSHFPPYLAGSTMIQLEVLRWNEHLEPRRKTSRSQPADTNTPNNEKRKETTIVPEKLPERQHFKGTKMQGAELQEDRKRRLLSRILLFEENPYPFAFLALYPHDFTQTVHALFDLSLLYSEGSISVRRITDITRRAALYRAHNIVIDERVHEYETLFVISRKYGERQPENDHEFDPVYWKDGFSIVQSINALYAQKLIERFGVSRTNAASLLRQSQRTLQGDE